MFEPAHEIAFHELCYSAYSNPVINILTSIGPVKYERYIRPTGLRYKKANVTHPELGYVFLGLLTVL
jgi:hypothetical protein